MNAAHRAPADVAPLVLLFAGWSEHVAGEPLELMPLCGEPLIKRAMDRLAAAGIKHVHVVLGGAAHAVRQYLGDGGRWGCALSFHVSAVGERLNQSIARLSAEPDQRVVLASAECDPGVALDQVLTRAVGDRPLALIDAAPGPLRWSGWAIAPAGWWIKQTVTADPALIAHRLTRHEDVARIRALSLLSGYDAADLLDSQQRALGLAENPMAGVLDPRGGHIHPSALLIPPIHLGRNVRIGANTRIGPNVSLGDGVVINREAIVEDSLVLPGTWVGRALELRQVIANGERLANARLDTQVLIADPQLMTSAQPTHRPGLPGARERLVARALHVLLAPVLRLQGNGAHLRHLREVFHPGLRQVAQGRMRLVGPSPRSASALKTLSPDWQALYEDHLPGLLNDLQFQHGTAHLPETQHACDALACAVQPRLAESLKMTARFLVNTVREVCPAGIREFRNGRNPQRRPQGGQPHP